MKYLALMFCSILTQRFAYSHWYIVLSYLMSNWSRPVKWCKSATLAG